MDFDALKREISANGSVRQAASSAEARKLAKNIDAAAVEKAAKSGDTAALKGILNQVLSTPEGKALAERVRKAVQEDHG